MSTTPRPDVSRFGSLSSDDRKRLLLKAYRSGESFRLGDFTGTADLSEVFVVDHDGGFDVGGRVQALLCAAEMLGLHVYEPTQVATDSGASRFEVWCNPSAEADMLNEPIMLGSGHTQEAANSAAVELLNGLVGSFVLPFQDWGAIKGPEYEAILKVSRKRAPPVYAETFTAHLKPTWASAGVYLWEIDQEVDASRVPQAEAFKLLDTHGSLKRLATVKRGAPSFHMKVVRLGEKLYAPFHDMVQAAREGILLSGLNPWPSVNANLYVVHRNFFRFMRAKGWRQPWRNEKPKHYTKLYGRVWVRDKPLDE